MRHLSLYADALHTSDPRKSVIAKHVRHLSVHQAAAADVQLALASMDPEVVESLLDGDSNPDVVVRVAVATGSQIRDLESAGDRSLMQI